MIVFPLGNPPSTVDGIVALPQPVLPKPNCFIFNAVVFNHQAVNNAVTVVAEQFTNL
jgi:hypothetical protein